MFLAQLLETGESWIIRGMFLLLLLEKEKAGTSGEHFYPYAKNKDRK